MDHQTTEVIESKALPGIRFTLVRMVEGHRIELRKRSAAVTRKMRPLVVELGKLQQRSAKLMPRADEMGQVPAEVQQTPELEEIQDRYSELMEQIDFIEQTELEPIWISWALLSIDGEELVEGQQASKLTIGGEPINATNVAFGPPALYNEIIAAIRKRIGLQPAAAKNSSSLTTLPESEGGTKSDTTAASADAPDSTELAIATSTSPAT